MSVLSKIALYAEMWKDQGVYNYSNLFLKVLTTEAGDLFRYLMNVTEKGDPLFRR